MKSTIKIFAIFAMVVGFAVGAKAQTKDGSIKGKATVLQDINVTGLRALSFGWISPGSTKTIGLIDDASGNQVGKGTETTGVFTVSAAVGSNVSIKFTLPSGLSAKNVAGAPDLALSSWKGDYGTAATSSSSHPFTPSTTATPLFSNSFPTNIIGSENAIYVFIGATVTTATSQPADDYEKDITLTATYN